MKTYEIHSRTDQARPAAVMTATVRVAGIGPWLASVYGTVASVIAAHGAYPAGPPFARYRRLDGDLFAVEAGFPVSTAIDADGDVRPAELPGGPAAVTVYLGPYDQMAAAYEALASWVSRHGGEPAGDPWEVYFTDPASEPDPAAWRTEIIQPYRVA
jgi:effector-binding domain-containing protein